jgi:hypothetical protein
MQSAWPNQNATRTWLRLSCALYATTALPHYKTRLASLQRDDALAVDVCATGILQKKKGARTRLPASFLARRSERTT